MIIKGKKEKSPLLSPRGAYFFQALSEGGGGGGGGKRKVKHMRLEVKRRKTENNMNFQPEETITDQSTLIVCEESRGGAG